MKHKLAFIVIALLVAWWLLGSDNKPAAAAAPGRASKELEIIDDVESPYFGMTPAEAAEAKRNPAVDPEMHALIDKSNSLIYSTTDPSDGGAP